MERVGVGGLLKSSSPAALNRTDDPNRIIKLNKNSIIENLAENCTFLFISLVLTRLYIVVEIVKYLRTFNDVYKKM